VKGIGPAEVPGALGLIMSPTLDIVPVGAIVVVAAGRGFREDRRAPEATGRGAR
jgi:hypothetical protein